MTGFIYALTGVLDTLIGFLATMTGFIYTLTGFLDTLQEEALHTALYESRVCKSQEEIAVLRYASKV